MLNPFGETDQQIVCSNFVKDGWAKRSLKREAEFRVKNQKFDVKLRFALIASLRSAFLSE